MKTLQTGNRQKRSAPSCKLVGFFLLMIFSVCAGAEVDYAVEPYEKILKKLIEVSGNYQVKAPEIQIQVASENEPMGAAYNKVTQVIILEKEFLDLCRSFGADAESAVAFILAHELTHHFQRLEDLGHDHISGFLSYGHNDTAHANKEKAADLQGAFCAWLAGYDLDIIPRLIEGLYETYGLRNRALPGYPSFEERMSIHREIKAEIDKLIQVYETSNYLTALGDYGPAREGFAYIEERYEGREVHNNIGVLYAMEAMMVNGKNIDPYILPFELDFETRLRKTRAMPFDENDAHIRAQKLFEAQHYLEKAIQLDPGYFSAYLNKVCVLTLAGDYLEADNYCTQAYPKAKTPAQKASLELARAVLYAYWSEKDPSIRAKARSLLEELEKHPASAIRALAAVNLKALNQEQLPPYDECDDCPFSFPGRAFPPALVGVKNEYTKFIKLESDRNREIYECNAPRYKTKLSFYKNPDKTDRSLQKGTSADTIKALLSEGNCRYKRHSLSNGFFFQIPACQLILQFDRDSRLKNSIWYYR